MKTISWILSLHLPGRVALASALLAGWWLAGCSKSAPNRVVIRGSNTVGEELVPRLIAEYKKSNPAAEFDLEFKGSSYGLGGLLSATCDIGASSRELAKFEPALAKERGLEFSDTVIGAYAVAVVLPAGSPVSNLSRDQVRDIFTGTIQNWQAVGGPDAAIHLFIRDPVSGAHLGFQDLAMNGKPYASSVKPFKSYAAIVAAAANDPQAIGYTSLDLVTRPGVKAVSIDGVMPTAAAVHGGKYPYARVLRLFTVKPGETPLARMFIDFVTSERGQKTVAEAGYLPKP